MNFKVVSIEKDGVVRLAAEGNMSSTTLGADGPHPFAKLLGEQWAGNRIVLDLSECSYLDSSAIGWLLSSQKQVQKQGGSLVIHSAPPSVQQIFNLLKIDRVLKLTDSEAEALTLARQGAE